VPYSSDKELIMDILKYGADVEVIATKVLREAVKYQLDAAASQYRCGNRTGSGFEPRGE
jgi:predicted DNA-binding transcriptional regulator YafY